MWRRGSLVGLGWIIGLLAACEAEIGGPTLLMRVPGALLISGWEGNVPRYAGTGGDVEWDEPPAQGDIAAPQVIVSPDTVDAGAAFEVRTYTAGPSGCWRADGQTVQVVDRTVVLKPYDAHSGSEVCTGALVFPEHRSTVALPESGEWTLRVDGRRLRMGDEVWEEPVSAERSIHVR